MEKRCPGQRQAVGTPLEQELTTGCGSPMSLRAASGEDMPEALPGRMGSSTGTCTMPARDSPLPSIQACSSSCGRHLFSTHTRTVGSRVCPRGHGESPHPPSMPRSREGIESQQETVLTFHVCKVLARCLSCSHCRGCVPLRRISSEAVEMPPEPRAGPSAPSLWPVLEVLQLFRERCCPGPHSLFATSHQSLSDVFEEEDGDHLHPLVTASPGHCMPLPLERTCLPWGSITMVKGKEYLVSSGWFLALCLSLHQWSSMGGSSEEKCILALPRSMNLPARGHGEKEHIGPLALQKSCGCAVSFKSCRNSCQLPQW
ncbi:uncharacterized protein LOC128806361 [Vidua macroura]|uniref:uncharacterized protein LOC128806361 n=1 Tax=Vidua macroura TaxID=187451 RepID=UPI0023A80245|nr:uncharacterized protein LOC128806361 [Vidua macroura]